MTSSPATVSCRDRNDPGRPGPSRTARPGPPRAGPRLPRDPLGLGVLGAGRAGVPGLRDRPDRLHVLRLAVEVERAEPGAVEVQGPGQLLAAVRRHAADVPEQPGALAVLH